MADDGWEEVVDVRKVKRAERLERRAEREAIERLSLGESDNHPDDELRGAYTSAKNASFYAQPTKKNGRTVGKGKQTGQLDEDLGFDPQNFRNPIKKRSTGGKKKAAQDGPAEIETADDIIEWLLDILEKNAVVNQADKMTVAALGDRFQSLTKVDWKKKLKPVFGGFSKFVAGRPELKVEGDWVRINPTQTQAQGNESTNKGKKSKAKSTQNTSTASQDDSEDEDEEDAGDHSVEKKKKKTKQSSSACSCSTILMVLFLGFISTAVVSFLLQQKRKQSS